MSPSTVKVTLLTHTASPQIQVLLGRKSPLFKDIEEFRGIPYATIPGRWRHSKIRARLPCDEFHAVQNGPKCPQPYRPGTSARTFGAHLEEAAGVVESEFDCLNLFVIRPSKESLQRRNIVDLNNGLPVLVYIHGGGFVYGAGTDPMWDPTRLVMQSIKIGSPFIAVNINYRLGVFGFAATRDMLKENRPHGVNFGLRDQKVALEWISQNISAFGGDPAKVTIAGQSAGGVSVHVQVLEAKLSNSKPLFRRAIIQSGAVGTTGPVDLDKAESHWNTLCQQLDLAKEHRSSLEAMRNVSVETLLKACYDLNYRSVNLVNDKITLDITEDLEPLLVDLGEVDGHVQGFSRHGLIEVLVGQVESESSITVPQAAAIKSQEEIEALVGLSSVSPPVASTILQAYGITSRTTPAKLISNLQQFYTDVLFSYPLSRAREFLVSSQPCDTNGRSDNDVEEGRTAHARVFHSTTVKRYDMRFGNPFPGPFQGVSHHCVDLIYIFDCYREYLEQADRTEAEAFNGSLGTLPSITRSSACYDLRGGLSDTKELGELRTAPVTNVSLMEVVQRQWIEFIGRDWSNEVVVKPTALLYGTDRSVKIVLEDDDQYFQEQKQRFAVLEENWAKVQVIASAISAGASSITKQCRAP